MKPNAEVNTPRRMLDAVAMVTGDVRDAWAVSRSKADPKINLLSGVWDAMKDNPANETPIKNPGDVLFVLSQQSLMIGYQIFDNHNKRRDAGRINRFLGNLAAKAERLADDM